MVRVHENAFRGRDRGPTGKRGFAATYARRKGEHGSAILETFYSICLIGVILIGVFQIFLLVVADMITDYSAFRGARSAAVGFREEYAMREAQIKSAPVSGQMIKPDFESYPGFGMNRVGTEKRLLREYMQDYREVEYANWHDLDPNPLNDFGQSVHFHYEFDHYPLSIPVYDVITGRNSVRISGEATLTNHASAFLE